MGGGRGKGEVVRVRSDYRVEGGLFGCFILKLGALTKDSTVIPMQCAFWALAWHDVHCRGE